MKILLLCFMLMLAKIKSASYLDNEQKYQEYDSTYSNKDFYIRPVSIHSNFMNGIDSSMVSRIEEMGGKYYDYDLQPKDYFSIIKENGINTVRFRLWYDWNSETGVKGGGMCDKERMLGLAIRAKKVGLKVLLDFHYSDNWADPGKQACPSAWKGMTFDQANNAMSRYTIETISYFVSNGVSVDYVQIGNEINNGFIFPYGQIDWSSEKTKKEGLDRVATLISTGAKAVKSISPNSKIIIHVGDKCLTTWHDEKSGKDVPDGLWFFQQMKERNVYYDIAAASFYLYYHHQSKDDWLDMGKITSGIDQFIDELGKPFIIMEYATAFTLNTHPYADNQFGSTQSKLIEKEYKTSFQGQVNYILDIAEKVSKAKNNMGMGIVYWGGDWLPVKGAGWADEKTKSSWSNQALFIYDGLASPALAAIKTISNASKNNIEFLKE